MKATYLAHAALFAVSLIYGANYTIAKWVMPDYIAPMPFIVLRTAFATLMFWLLHLLVFREKVSRSDIPRLALCGLFGTSLNQLLFFEGLNLTTPIQASLLMMTTPILVLIASAFILKERVTTRKILGITLGLSGAALIIMTTGSDAQSAPNPILGNTLVILNAASYGIYLILVKPLMQRYHPLTVVKFSFTFGFLYTFGFGYSGVQNIEWATFTTKIWAAVLFILLGLTFFAYLLNAMALRALSPSIVSSYIYLQPLLATFIALAMGSDRLTFFTVLATALIFTGVYLVSMSKKVAKIE